MGRDRYTSNIKCPSCHKEGVLHISEDDHPFMKKLYRSADKIDGDFVANMQGEFDIKILCQTCNETFIWSDS